jgi:predicted kinase
MDSLKEMVGQAVEPFVVPEKVVTILRGISGAGKSTYTNQHFRDALVCSADHYFGHGANYRFNASLLGKAHDQCFQLFRDAVQAGKPSIVLDNTNTMLKEFKRYIELAEKFGYTVNVVRLVVDPAVAAKRNVHGVPPSKVQQMQDRFVDYPGETIIHNN